MTACLVCRRTLKKEPSLSRGVGPVCSKKIREMAGMSGSGGKEFSVLGDEFWDRFIQEHAAIRNRQEHMNDSLAVLRTAEHPQGVQVAAEQVGSYQVYGKKIKNDQDLATMFRDLASSDREKMYVACCDEKGNVLGTQCTSIGTLDASFAVSREILKAPFLLGAKKFYLLHNHPSGNPGPSQDDLNVTKNINAAAEAVGIEFSGHAVIGKNGYAFIEPNGNIFESNKEYKQAKKHEIPLFDTSQKDFGGIVRTELRDPDMVLSYAKNEIFREDKKGMFLIAVNTKHETVGISPFSENDFTQNTRSLVMSNASGFFLIGDADVEEEKFRGVSQQLKAQAKILGIDFIDGVKATDRGGVKSLLEENIL